MSIAVLLAGIVITGLILMMRSKREDQSGQEIVEHYVNTIFLGQTYRPEVKAEFVYGIPSFSLEFKTDKEKEHAISNGLTDQFLKKIQELHGHLRPRGEPFNAAKAVAIFSKEDVNRWMEQGEK